MYGPGPPGSHPSTDAPAHAARSAAADAPAPAAPTTWIRSPGAIGRGSRAGARPAPISAAARTVTRPRRPLEQHLERRPRRVALVLRPVPRPLEAADRRLTVAGDRHVDEADGLGLGAAVRAGDPRDRDAEIRADRRERTPSAIATATCAETAPWASSTSAGTPSSCSLTAFEYATTPPTRYADDPGTSVTTWATRPPVHDSAVATVSPRATHRAWRRSRELDERVRHVRCGRSGRAGRVARTARFRGCSCSTCGRGRRR